jgi:hypothetical protein
MNCIGSFKRCKHRLPYYHCRLEQCAYIEGGILNWTKYSRENIPKPLPKYKVGDEVILTTRREIMSVGKDCDGTPLYELDNIGFGWSEKELRHAPTPVNKKV